MSKSPTARTLERLREDGWTVDVVERFNSFTNTRHDFCGFADLIAYRGDMTKAIQATSASNVSARVGKLNNEPRAIEWVSGRFRTLEVWGWRKYKKPVDRKLWRPLIISITNEGTDAGTPD